MRASKTVAALLITAAMTACGTSGPDYSSNIDTPTTTTVAPPEVEQIPISVYLEQSGVIGAPMKPDTLTGLTVSIPAPAGWAIVEDINYRDYYEVLRKTVDAGYPPQALLAVFQLTGDFDITEALKHAFVSAEMSQGWTRLNASNENFGAWPSATIEGSYDLLGQRLHTYQRTVIPTTTAGDRYLVQFTITSAADQAAPLAPDIETLIDGFTISEP